MPLTEADFAEAAQPPSPLESAGRGVQQGLSLNWADRAHALAAASPFENREVTEQRRSDPTLHALAQLDPGSLEDLIGGGARMAAEHFFPETFGHKGTEAYEKRFGEERKETERAQKANPGSYLGGELGGGLLSALFMPEARLVKGAAEGAPLLARAARGATNMASTGALYGGLVGAGSANDVSAMPEEAAKGAGLGFVAGPVVGGAARGVGNVAGYLGRHMGASFNPEGAAIDMLARKMHKTGADPQALESDVSQVQNAGVPSYTVADAAAEKLDGLPGSIARSPGEARSASREFLEGRQFGDTYATGQRARIEDAVGDFLGTKGKLGKEEQIIQDRAAASTPLYDAAHQDPITMTPKMTNVLERLRASGAYESARKMLDLEGMPMDFGTLKPWDYMKRALDDKIDVAKRSGENNLARIYTGMKKQLVGELDAQSSNYAQARQVFSSHSDLRDALADGANAIKRNMTREQLEADLKKMSPSEKEMYRLGASNALRDQLVELQGTSKLPMAMKTGSGLWQKLNALAPNKAAFDNFATKIKAEGEMSATRQKAYGGSQTAERLAEDQINAHDVTHSVNMISNLARGRIGEFVKQTIPYLVKVDPNQRAAVMNEARKIILNPDKTKINASMAKIKRRLDQMKVGDPIRDKFMNSLGEALVPGIEQPKAPVQPSGQNWKLLQHQRTGQNFLWNHQTGEMQPYNETAQA